MYAAPSTGPDGASTCHSSGDAERGHGLMKGRCSERTGQPVRRAKSLEVGKHNVYVIFHGLRYVRPSAPFRRGENYGSLV